MTERKACTRSSAMSTTNTLIRLPSGARTSAPGWPLTGMVSIVACASSSCWASPTSSRLTLLRPTIRRIHAGVVAGYHDIIGQETDQALQVTVADGVEEPGRKLVAPGR